MEFKEFLRLMILMGLMNKLSLVEYWSKNNHISAQIPKKSMPHRRFIYLLLPLWFRNTDYT